MEWEMTKVHHLVSAGIRIAWEKLNFTGALSKGMQLVASAKSPYDDNFKRHSEG